MKHSDGIGKDWAKKILASGYEADKKEPMTTKAKVWNKKKKRLVEVTIELGPKDNAKRCSRGYYLDNTDKRKWSTR